MNSDEGKTKGRRGRRGQWERKWEPGVDRGILNKNSEGKREREVTSACIHPDAGRRYKTETWSGR